VQDLLGVHEPNFGVLLDDMFVDEGEEVRVDTACESGRWRARPTYLSDVREGSPGPRCRIRRMSDTAPVQMRQSTTA
jgi:hypothetical protein